MPIYTKGFATAHLLEGHFNQHRSDFGATSEEEYEEMADKFVGGPRDMDTQECTNSKRDVIRYNDCTREYGVKASDGFIRTYYKPVPRGPSRGGFRSKFTHSEATNMDYFRRECNK